MRALELFAPGRLRLIEVPRPVLRPTEVRVRVACAAVCGSDLSFWRNPRHLPQILGHEFAGTVIEAGAEAASLITPGDRVTASAVMGCMQCAACAAGRYRFCEEKRILGFQVPGAFAEEVVFDGRFALPLPPELSFEQGALIEPLGCGYCLARRILYNVENCEASILILGDGPIALADLQMLRILGFRNVFLVGRHRLRTDIAMEIGASLVLDSGDLSDLASLPRLDVCIVAADADATLMEVVPRIKPEGSLYVQTRSEASGILKAIVTPELKVFGAFAYELSDLRETIALVAQGQIETGRLITARFCLSQAVEEFPRLLQKGSRVKTLLKPG